MPYHIQNMIRLPYIRQFIIPALLAALLVTPSCKSSKSSVPATVVAVEAEDALAPATVWKAYDAFNRVYLDTDRYIYRNTNRDKAARDRWHGAAAIWCQPMYVDMALNAVELARKQGDKQREKQYAELLDRLLEGNIRHYLNFDFDNNDTNLGWFIYDDIQWWTITMARAYLATGNERYRQLAEQSFARVWYGSPVVGDTGSYADPAKGLNGGMFWQWQPLEGPKRNEAGDGKMSCINFPTVVAAMLLYQAAPADRAADPAPIEWINKYGEFSRPRYETKERYLEMAKEIYDWSVKNLSNPGEPGMIHDSSHGGRAGGHPLIYNQGTFIGAGALLYLATGDERYLNDAKAGADYSINTMSAEHGLLPWAHNQRKPYDQGSLEQGIYPAIWAQYMKLLIDDCGQRQYLPFLVKNVESGWSNRNKNDICDGESWAPAPDHALIGSYAASSVPSLMLVTALLNK